MTEAATTLPAPEASPGPEDLVTLCRQALVDSATYVEFISTTMAVCAQQIRTGDDQTALGHLAQGSSDLEQFLQLMEHVTAVAKPATPKEVDAFRADLLRCVRGMEQSLVQQDLVTLSDQIEGDLLQVLPRWDGVAEELALALEVISPP
ncbi:MAG: hypothetical protein IT371_12720 [Deltaproteobacteria bacterium]|nr:hypothetical protein [Deltaproteobacteria bacterium]